MAAYNAEATIRDSILSVQHQTQQALELIIVNDGSDDDTVAVIEDMDFPNIRLFTQNNQGQSLARNIGLKHALGNLIAFIDADDIWLPEKLELQTQALNANPSASVCYGWANVIDHEQIFMHTDARVRYSGCVYEQLLKGNFIVSGSNTLIKKSAIESVAGYDTSFRAIEDWDIHVRLSRYNQYINIPAVVVKYRKHEGSVSANVELMEHSFIAIRNKLYSNAPDHLQRYQTNCTASFYRYLALRNLQVNDGKFSLSIHYYLIAFKLEPLNWRENIRCFWPWGPMRLILKCN